VPNLGTIAIQKEGAPTRRTNTMKLNATFDLHESTVVGFGFRTLLVTSDTANAVMTRRLNGLGCRVEACDELYSALDRLIDDPSEFELIVIDCDSIGGLATAKRAHLMLKITERCFPVILVSSEVAHHDFPHSRHDPTILRGPITALSLRVGFEHAMQDRLYMNRAI
jgi:CheY-like chemotaxis protein